MLFKKVVDQNGRSQMNGGCLFFRVDSNLFAPLVLIFDIPMSVVSIVSLASEKLAPACPTQFHHLAVGRSPCVGLDSTEQYSIELLFSMDK